MEVKDFKETVKITKSIHIYDDELKMNWFIILEERDGSFISIKEEINYDFFRKQGFEYMWKVYELAYNVAYPNNNPLRYSPVNKEKIESIIKN